MRFSQKYRANILKNNLLKTCREIAISNGLTPLFDHDAG